MKLKVMLGMGLIVAAFFAVQNLTAPRANALTPPGKTCGTCVVKLDGSMTCDGVEWKAAGCYKQECRCVRTIYE